MVRQGMSGLGRWLWLLLLAAVAAGPAVAAEQCERLHSGLSYTQEDAPRDVSSLMPVVIKKVNQKLEGVTNVQVEWHGGDFHGRVGEHTVLCRVTRLASAMPQPPPEDAVVPDAQGRPVVEQCLHFQLSITDTNECTLPPGHPMQHQCHEPAICVNTIGSYECVCPRLEVQESFAGITADEKFWASLKERAAERSPWEVSFGKSSRTTCPSSVTTFGCCRESAHTDHGRSCRSGFRCPEDPCARRSLNECADTALCTRKESPISSPNDPNYDCLCPQGLMGNGRRCRPGIDPDPNPQVMYDGVTPTEETIKNNYYCGCTTPVIDACAGFSPCEGKNEACAIGDDNAPVCACKPGYVHHEKYGCVDESPPTLRLKNDPNGDGILRLKQGDFYQEYAVDILDENAEEYMRSLKVSYSHPLPPGCLLETGEFYVDYTVATPWTSPSNVTIRRRVIIEDIDECAVDRAEFAKTCPALVPLCDEQVGARCVNTHGSYTCKCPEFTTGDGFQRGVELLSGAVPEGFKGGTSCVDTGIPVITLAGPNPKVFRVCACNGVSGVMDGKSKSADLSAMQKQHYSADIAKMIEATAGAELCATSTNPNPSPRDCVKAYDQTYKGRVDLTHKVTIGEPVQKSSTHWSVPYDVVDEAGNSAKTVWRDIKVEEMDLAKLEASIRSELQQAMQAEKEEAVRRAVEIERKTKGATARKESETQNTCQCPVCTSGAVDTGSNQSDGYCELDGSRVMQILLWLENYLSRSLAQVLMLLSVVFGFLMIVYVFMATLFAPQIRRRQDAAFEAHSEERVRALQQGIAYYPSEPPPYVQQPASSAVSIFEPSTQQGARSSTPRIPRTSVFLNEADNHRSLDYMSPPPNGSATPRTTPPSNGGRFPVDGVHYESPLKITPSKRGDGVRRRSTGDRSIY